METWVDKIGIAKHAAGWQYGEAGILAHLGDWLPFCQNLVEIGAGDGKELPLSLGVSIDPEADVYLYEADEARQESLREVYPNAIVRGLFNGTELQRLPVHIAALVVDVDGYDLEITQAILRSGRVPTVLMVEHWDLCAPRQITTTPPHELLGAYTADGWCIQAPLQAVADVVEDYGYCLAGYTRLNSIWISRNHPLWRAAE